MDIEPAFEILITTWTGVVPDVNNVSTAFLSNLARTPDVKNDNYATRPIVAASKSVLHVWIFQ
jgi:hypothetical protein